MPSHDILSILERVPRPRVLFYPSRPAGYPSLGFSAQGLEVSPKVLNPKAPNHGRRVLCCGEFVAIAKSLARATPIFVAEWIHFTLLEIILPTIKPKVLMYSAIKSYTMHHSMGGEGPAFKGRWVVKIAIPK